MQLVDSHFLHDADVARCQAIQSVLAQLQQRHTEITNDYKDLYALQNTRGNKLERELQRATSTIQKMAKKLEKCEYGMCAAQQEQYPHSYTQQQNLSFIMGPTGTDYGDVASSYMQLNLAQGGQTAATSHDKSMLGQTVGETFDPPYEPLAKNEEDGLKRRAEAQGGNVNKKQQRSK
jgi:hypothetical protein